MKVMTILGTRPEIIRLSRIIPKLDIHCDHVLVHTGQNFDRNLSAIFFNELELRSPDYYFGIQAETFADQVAKIFVECEKVMNTERPDCLLILGDTNSGLSAIVAKRLGIPVYHMEAGNRCFDDRVPEEVNRRLIDHSSDILMPYTERGRENLLREGIPGERIFVTGNPIKEVLDYHTEKIASSQIIADLDIQAGQYFLVTLHRAENVDSPQRLDLFIQAFHNLHKQYNVPVIWSLYPRTRKKLQSADKRLQGTGIRIVDPLGLFDFVHLEQQALCVLSDSGTVQEECCLLHVPSVTLREVTERPETLEAGSNLLSGPNPEDILRCVRVLLSEPPRWTVPPEYQISTVSQTVLKLLLGYRKS